MTPDLEKTDEIPKDELDALLDKFRGAAADTGSLGTPVDAEAPRLYHPYSFEVSVPIVTPWLVVKDKGHDSTHDSDNCHCVQCCVAYRAHYQRNAAMAIEASKLVDDTKVMVRELIGGGMDTSRRSTQSAREDLEHGASAWLSPAERKLRMLLAFAYSKPGSLYGDDGELHDSTMPFPIDYMRDSIDQIQQQMHNRGMVELSKVKL